MTTWNDIHAGDKMRGKDQRAWTVVWRQPGLEWVNAGPTAEFMLRRDMDGRETQVVGLLAQPVELVERADHGAEATAVGALIEQGLQPSILEERVSAQPEIMSPAVKIETDRWGRYKLPHPETGEQVTPPRATTVARAIADQFGLQQWELRQVAKGVAMRDDLIAKARMADPEEDKKQLAEVAKTAKEVAGSSKGANMGNAFHSAAKMFHRGTPTEQINLPAPLDADFAAYVKELRAKRLKPRPDLVERIVFEPTLFVAGQLDLIIEQPAGVTKSLPLAIYDVKSGKSLDYSWLEICIQMAIYAHAKWMWNPQGFWEPMPEVDQHRGIVAHTPIGQRQTVFHGVDLIKGWRYAQLAIEVRKARSDKGLSWLVEPSAEEMLLHNVSRATGQADLAALWEKAHPAGLWTQEVNQAAQQRLAEINSQPQPQP